MLTKNDLTEIKNLIKQQIDEAVAQITVVVGKVLEGMTTKDDIKDMATKTDILKLEGRFDGVERRLNGVETDITDLKRDVQDIKADMPTKDDFKNLKKLEEIHRKELESYA